MKVAAVVAAIDTYCERTDTLPRRVRVPLGWDDGMRDEMEDRFWNKPWKDKWLYPLRVLGVPVEESGDVVGPVAD